ncbi:hypothetical protein BN7_1394 [Wickerhamomyces ciferrii]|uniref:Uncharacterized protein n=1 Tax=Wickerhamomyces ciferrii (strain ATCC 14091 / BCRC 22168 / CBS 111 / JCM 3599 / NBRC 0793 / NRRL Y-1031 F-60-10) TaxID=1206466 RepID=K0KA90_WICCF|nr:uncharacterized protein BN7_1394 [Wickerhamomyces ciferrii]CCH41855.1 hypothetical protein BN7_1394 [Wickerhamomyces ciferrii]
MNFDPRDYSVKEEFPVAFNLNDVPMTQVVLDLTNEDEDEDDMDLLFSESPEERGSRSLTADISQQYEDSETEKSIDAVTHRGETPFINSSDTEHDEIEHDSQSQKSQQTVVSNLFVDPDSNDWSTSQTASLKTDSSNDKREYFFSLEDDEGSSTEQPLKKSKTIINQPLENKTEGEVDETEESEEDEDSAIQSEEQYQRNGVPYEEERASYKNYESNSIEQQNNEEIEEDSSDVEITTIVPIPPKMSIDELRPLLRSGVAIGLGIAAYEHREELRELYEDVKVGVEAAIAERRRRKVSNRPYRTGPNDNPFLAPGERESDYDDDDLYQTAGSQSSSTLRVEESQERSNNNDGQSEGDFWDSSKSSTSNDGQTSGIYNRTATFRERGRRNRRTASPQVQTSFSEDVTTGIITSSSGEETPEDEPLPSYSQLNNNNRFLRN